MSYCADKQVLSTHTDGRLREKHKYIVMGLDEDSSAYSESFKESGVYQLGVPQGQEDSSAPSTTDPLICGFCLVTTPNTRGKTVEQSIVTWMFVREFITNCHPVAPQLTNKPCTNGGLREKHKCIVMRIDEDYSAYSESFKRRTHRQTDAGNDNTRRPKLASVKIQHWFRQWIGAVRQLVTIWANVVQDLCYHMASLGNKELNIHICTAKYLAS